MPGGGIHAATEITAALPDTTIVMLTVSRDDDLFAALRAGASGYLLKDVDAARLPDALRAGRSGEAAGPRAQPPRVGCAVTVRRRVSSTLKNLRVTSRAEALRLLHRGG